MPDRSLVLGLETPYHYFNAGVMLFDALALSSSISPTSLVDYFQKHRALCRFREQCALNRLLRGQVQYLPGQYNLLSWMRKRSAQGRWHDIAANPMAYCLPDVWDRMAIVHLSAGALPSQVDPSRHERLDRYWLYLQHALQRGQPLAQLPRFGDW